MLHALCTEPQCSDANDMPMTMGTLLGPARVCRRRSAKRRKIAAAARKKKQAAAKRKAAAAKKKAAAAAARGGRGAGRGGGRGTPGSAGRGTPAAAGSAGRGRGGGRGGVGRKKKKNESSEEEDDYGIDSEDSDKVRGGPQALLVTSCHHLLSSCNFMQIQTLICSCFLSACRCKHVQEHLYGSCVFVH